MGARGALHNLTEGHIYIHATRYTAAAAMYLFRVLYISNFIADLDYHLPAIHTQATTQTTKRWRIWRVLVVVVSKAPLPNGSGMV